MNDFDELIETVENLPYESQEIFVDIINKRFSERKRLLFIADTLLSASDYKNGLSYKGSSEDLFETLGI